MCPSHMRTHYALHPGCLSIRLSPVPVRKAGTHWRQSRLLPIQSTLLFVLATNRQQFNSTAYRGRLNCRYGRLCHQCVPGLTQQQLSRRTFKFGGNVSCHTFSYSDTVFKLKGRRLSSSLGRAKFRHRMACSTM